MKLMHIVNEKTTNESDFSLNPRVAFRELLSQGVLTKLDTFSFLADWIQYNDPSMTQRKIIKMVHQHRPDVLFWQHIVKFPIKDSFFTELRQIHPKILVVYHEGDPFGRYIKKPTKSMSCIIRNSNIVFWEGLGSLRELAIKFGAKYLYLAPSNFDHDRFWGNWTPTLKRKFDVSMIANRGKTRIPFRYIPGGKRREKCVKLLTQAFKSRFALYGHGWKNSISYQGSLPFDKQHEAIQQSWISANWDHFDNIDYYNSNRLPISLAAGVPHITTLHPGFEYLYKNIEGGLYFAQNPSEVIDIAFYLLSKPVDELIEEGHKAQQFARKYLTSIVVYGRMVKKIKEHLNSSS